MQKRILAYILTLAMVISLIPAFALTASAAVGIAADTTNISVGKTVYYGKYPQSLLGMSLPSGTEGVDWVKSTAPATGNGYTEGTEYYFAIEPIAWRVLSNSGGKLFLLSEKNLDAGKPYNLTDTNITWENSTIRKWLNGLSGNPHDYSFIDWAFPAKEQAAILTTTIDNHYNAGAGWQWPTDDKIFFLSTYDAQNFTLGFANDASRIAVNTAYTAHFGAMQGSGTGDHWWLRSAGNIGSYAALVLNHGDINLNGYRVDYDFVAARPAFELNLSNVLFESDASGENAKSSATVESGLVGVTTPTGAIKFTMLDSSLELGSVTQTSISGRTITFDYSGATTDKTLSAVVLDDIGNVRYYGKLVDVTSASGTAEVTVPSDFAPADTLQIFVEEANGDNFTDFASAYVSLATPPALAGAVSITGTAKYGETLMAVPEITSNLPGALTYQWKRGTSNIGTDSSTYTLTSADVGQTVTVTVTAANYFGSLTSSAVTVNKATAPSIVFPTASAITYGQTLADSTLTGGVGDGTFAWADGSVTPTVVNSGYAVTFTPSADTLANYETINTLSDTVEITVNKAVIDISDILGVIAPVRGATPVTAITDTEQYIGIITWSGTPTAFAANTVYTATVTLTETANYTLTGVAENFFTVSGATATNDADIGIITAVFPKTATNSSGGGSSTISYTISYTITFEYCEDETLVKSERASYVWNRTLTAADLKIPKGYELAQDSFRFTVTNNATVKIEIKKIEETSAPTPTPDPVGEEKPYISGYPNGTFNPDGEITRAEVMQMLYNMLGNNAAADLGVLDTFGDMSEPHWADIALAWAARNGYIKGYDNGNIMPNEPMSRAELSAVLHRVAQSEGLFGEVGTASVHLSDIAGHWAYDDVMALAVKGIVQGYSDGTFKPDNAVTRVETVVMLARLFGRTDEFKMDKMFADVPSTHWAYNHIMNAANGN